MTVRVRALAATDRLVVHPAIPADEQVVHRALTRCADALGQRLRQRAETDVSHPLAHLDVAGTDRGRPQGGEIGRASRRERVCQYVYISGVAVSLKKKIKKKSRHK